MILILAQWKASQMTTARQNPQALSPGKKLHPCLYPANGRSEQPDLQRRSFRKRGCTLTCTRLKSKSQRNPRQNNSYFCLFYIKHVIYIFSGLLTFYNFSTLCSPRSQFLQLKKEKLEYIPGEHEYGLFPAPIHVGRSFKGYEKLWLFIYFFMLSEVSFYMQRPV